jgi:hypothetical protein
MSRSRPALKVRAYRPRLEILEDRTVPSTFVVDHLADDTVGSGLTGSLRYALTNAADNDHITFGVTGTINLTGALPNLAHGISIEGPGAAQLTVRRNTGGSYGIFVVGSGATVSISGLSITNGYTDSLSRFFGGGIDNLGTLTVSDCTISGNTANVGGGILNGGTLTVSDCTISGNTANTDGVSTGSNSEGGGVFNDGTAVLRNSTISGNRATLNGGGLSNGSPLYYEDGGVMTVSNCTISDNVAAAYSEEGGNYGGNGISNAGVMTVSDSTISGNGSGIVRPGVGGGILNLDGASMEITNSTISNNRKDDGGGIFNLGQMTISDSTISGNATYTDIGDGGGVNTAAGDLNMRNTILAGNSSSSSGPDLYGSLSSSGHNLIGNTEGGSGFAVTDLLNVTPLLGPLQDNGGPTPTMALLAGSPALNAGDPTQLGVADQRGVVRRGGVNIGAYQASASAFVLTAPATATAGTPFDVTVKAVDSFGQTAVGYTGTVHFGSFDGQAVLPGNYTFTITNAGMHTFSSAFTLKTAGSQTVTAVDTVTSSITGSAAVSVNPAAADHLLFLQQPTDTPAGQTMGAVVVEVVDAFGNVETSDNSDTITLSIGANPSGGTLSGTLTVTVVNGVATFSDLSIDLAGVGYTLHASIGGGLPDTDSNPFNVTM